MSVWIFLVSGLTGTLTGFRAKLLSRMENIVDNFFYSSRGSDVNTFRGSLEIVQLDCNKFTQTEEVSSRQMRRSCFYLFNWGRDPLNLGVWIGVVSEAWYPHCKFLVHGSKWFYPGLFSSFTYSGKQGNVGRLQRICWKWPLGEMVDNTANNFTSAACCRWPSVTSKKKSPVSNVDVVVECNLRPATCDLEPQEYQRQVIIHWNWFRCVVCYRNVHSLFGT